MADKKKTVDLSSLRMRAEEMAEKDSASFEGMPSTDVQRLIEELHIHQVELEMQNEELRTAQMALSQLSDKFEDLYLSAPVGYLTMDPKGVILDCNRMAITMLEAHSSPLIGQSFSSFIHPEDQDIFYLHHRKILTSLDPQSCEIRLKKSDSVIFPARMESIAIHDSQSQSDVLRTILIDISEPKAAEIKLKSALQEKAILLQELHHRVKNNMQVIISLLKIHTDSVTDAQARTVLEECEKRVFVMASAHETLYETENLAELELSLYLTKISDNILQSHGVNPGNIILDLKIDPISLDIDHAAPLGLVVNELLINVMKHAFPGGSGGTITIQAQILNGSTLELIVADNGVGMPADTDWRNTGTLGLHLAVLLVESQLHGSIELDNANGCRFVIRIDLPA
jgi:PAS domain S-box-containing protein